MVSQKAQKDLRQNTKAASTTLLNERLADAIDLALSIKQAHWNLKGPQFIALHMMLDQLRGEVDGHVDMIAERVAQLGGTALGTTQSVAKATTLRGYPTDIYKARDHLAALIERYGATANAVRRAIDEADEAGDAGTTDIFTAFSRALDKSLWFLEAHVQQSD